MKKILFLCLGLFLVLSLGAITAIAAAPNWNIGGTWMATHEFGGNTYIHQNNIVQASDGTLTGTGGWDGTQNGVPFSTPNTWDVTAGSSVYGNTVHLNYHYATVETCATDGYVDATINSDGSMTGIWHDNCGGVDARTGTWTVGAGVAKLLPSVTTNPATDMAQTTATVHGTNGPVAADDTSFWWGTSPIGTLTSAPDPSSEFPSGWSHDTGLGAASAGASFIGALTGLTPNTTYHFVAWAHVSGVWYPDTVLDFATLASETPAPVVDCPVGTTQSVSPVDVVTVNPDGNPHASLINLASGMTYLVKASGTYTFAPSWLPSAGIADAAYSLRAPGYDNAEATPQWISGSVFSSPYTNYLELWMNDSVVDWGSFNPSNTYATVVTGTNAPASFKILDDVYGDNSGSLAVNIYSCTPNEPQCNNQATQTIVSDTSNMVNGSSPAVEAWVHPLWATISGVKWIWSENQVSDPTSNHQNVFTKTFNIVGSVTSANLEMAADNGYIVKVNGHEVVNKITQENSYTSTASYDVKSLLVSGFNTLEITVKNFALANSTYQTNPAGLIYKLTINNNECVTPQLLPSVTTNPATDMAQTTATVHGTNGPVAADDTSFWWGTSPIGTLIPASDASSQFPSSGWSHDTGLGAASAGASFSGALTGLTPNTTYHFVAWAHVSGVWYPDTVLDFKTKPAAPTDKDQCKKDGWRRWFQHDGSPFRNQGECESSVVSHRDDNNDGHSGSTHHPFVTGEVEGAFTSIYGDSSAGTDLHRKLLALMTQYMNLLQTYHSNH